MISRDKPAIRTALREFAFEAGSPRIVKDISAMLNKFKRGEEHYKARFTEQDVLDMRRRRKAGESLKSIAYDYETIPQDVHNIVTGRTWKHVGEIVEPRFALRGDLI